MQKEIIETVYTNNNNLKQVPRCCCLTFHFPILLVRLLICLFMLICCCCCCSRISVHNYSGFFSAFIFFQRFFLFFFSWLKEKMHFGFSCARLVIKKFMHIFAFHSLVSLFLSFPLKCVNDCNGYKEMSIMITYMRDCIALTSLQLTWPGLDSSQDRLPWLMI